MPLTTSQREARTKKFQIMVRTLRPLKAGFAAWVIFLFFKLVVVWDRALASLMQSGG